MNNTYIGYFRLVDKRENKILKRYDYNKISAKERKELKEQLEKNSHLGIYCDCVEDNIELKIASNLVIYNYQRNIGERHHPSCPKYKDTDLVTWTYSQKEKAYKAGMYNTAQDYVVKMNSFIYQDNDVKTLDESFKKIKRAAYKIITDKDERLSYLTNPTNVIKNKDVFIYGYVGILNKTDKYIEILSLTNKEPNQLIKVLADFEKFNTLYSENRYYTLPENRKPLLIGGWAHYESSEDNYVFTDFWLKAVDNSGKIF